MRSLGKQWFGPACGILVLALLGYGVLLQPGKVPYSPHSDIVAYHLGVKEVLVRSWQAGRGVPYWRSDQLAGGPTLTNPNALYTHPLHFLFYVLPLTDAMGWTLWLHLVVGAGGYYVLGYALGLGHWPRMLMAAAALFNFKVLMAVYAGWLSVLPSIVLVPFLFSAVFRVAQAPGPGTGLALAAVGALSLHGGHLQLVYYSGWFLAVYLLWTQIAAWRAGQRREVQRVLFWLSAGLVLAVGMTAYLLLPLAGESSLVSRTFSTDAFLLRRHSIGLRHLLTLFYPEALGTPLDGSYEGTELWENVAYFGILPLLLAGAGAALGHRRRFTPFLVAGFGVSVLLSLDTPLIGLLYGLLPGLHLFRLPARLLFLAAHFGIALAGIGLDEVLTRWQRRNWSALGSHILAGTLVLAIAGEGTHYANRYLSMMWASDVLPNTDFSWFLAGDRSPFRIAPVGAGTVNYGWAASMKLQMITGYEPFNLRHYQEYLQLMQSGQIGRTGGTVWTDLEIQGPIRWDMLDALNAKYLLAGEPLQLPPERFDLVAHYLHQPFFRLYLGRGRTPVFIYRNLKALPRAFWVEQVAGAEDENAVKTEMLKRNLRDAAVVHSAPAESACGPGSPKDRVTLIEAAEGHLITDTDSETCRFLVISEIWHPGWRAFLDGRELRLHRTDLALMGVWVPAGRHRLQVQFYPLYWHAALSVSLLSSFIFLGWLLYQAVRRPFTTRAHPGDLRPGQVEPS